MESLEEQASNMAKLINIIGPSGSGKSTVHEQISLRLKDSSYNVESLSEPNSLRWLAKSYRLEEGRNPWTETAIYTVDRFIMYREKIMPRMKDDNLIFLLERGLPDTIVYQGMLGQVDIASILKMNSSIPGSDLYLALIVEGKEGHARVLDRSSETGEAISPNETAERIEELSDCYRMLSSYLKNLHIIDTTNLKLDEVIGECMGKIKEVV